MEELDALLAAAQQLASEGEALPVRLERECRQLRDAATLYCLCRLPYDQDRPMLACDYCSNWFHYDCVGLDPPGALHAANLHRCQGCHHNAELS